MNYPHEPSRQDAISLTGIAACVLFLIYLAATSATDRQFAVCAALAIVFGCIGVHEAIALVHARKTGR